MAKSDKKSKKSKSSKSGKKAAKAASAAPPAKAKDRDRVAAGPGGVSRNPAIDGVLFSTAQAGVRYAGRTDVMLVDIAPGSTLAGVFTRSATRSAAVLDCQAKLAKLSDKPRHGFAIVVNSGNANTFTGQRGVRDVDVIAAAAAGRGRPGRACLHLVHRRHRGTAERQQDHRRPARVGGGPERRRFEHRRARHHDDRHLSQGRVRTGRDRRHDRHHRGHRQGVGHDRARTWRRCWATSSPTRPSRRTGCRRC
jgi:hypothetical protein